MKILCAEADLYIAEIGEPAALRVALGPRYSEAEDQWQMGADGKDYKIWISSSAHRAPGLGEVKLVTSKREVAAMLPSDTGCLEQLRKE